MQQITFTITEKEVREVTGKDLSDNQVEEILTTVENDQVLWDQIQDSIQQAITGI